MKNFINDRLCAQRCFEDVPMNAPSIGIVLWKLLDANSCVEFL